MRRALGLVLGSVLIVVLLRLLPADVFAVTQGALFLAAAAILVLVSAALFLAPARRLLSSLFVLGLRVADRPLFAPVPEPQMRRTLAPLLVAAVCAAVAAVAGLARGL